MPDSAPLVKHYEASVPSVAAGADKESNIVDVELAGTVSSVIYIPDTILTGANTDSRTINLVNKGQSGAGSTVVATKAFTSGVNAPADDETAITLSGTAANLVVADGDILAWQSNHVGATGLADPGGRVAVEVTRS